MEHIEPDEKSINTIPLSLVNIPAQQVLNVLTPSNLNTNLGRRSNGWLMCAWLLLKAHFDRIWNHEYNILLGKPGPWAYGNKTSTSRSFQSQLYLIAYGGTHPLPKFLVTWMESRDMIIIAVYDVACICMLLAESLQMPTMTK